MSTGSAWQGSKAQRLELLYKRHIDSTCQPSEIDWSLLRYSPLASFSVLQKFEPGSTTLDSTGSLDRSLRHPYAWHQSPLFEAFSMLFKSCQHMQCLNQNSPRIRLAVGLISTISKTPDIVYQVGTSATEYTHCIVLRGNRLRAAVLAIRCGQREPQYSKPGQGRLI